jgi:hypothetical protein
MQEARADPLSLLCEYNGLDTSDRLLSSKVTACVYCESCMCTEPLHIDRSVIDLHHQHKVLPRTRRQQR